MNTKRKKHVVPWIIGGVLLSFFLVFLLIPYLARLGYPVSPFQMIDNLGFYKHASRYDLKVGQFRRGVLGKWLIEKKQDPEDGTVYLQIRNTGQKEEEQDYLTFYLYDSGRIAKKHYDRLLAFYADYLDEQDRYWFVAEEPGVVDAEVTKMYYRDGSLIIAADIDVRSTWAEKILPLPDEQNAAGSDTGTVSSEDAPDDDRKPFDRRELKPYILRRGMEVHMYVVDVLLPLSKKLDYKIE